MKILFAGDTHGDIHHFTMLCHQAKRNDIDTIIQVGDFGYWEHFPWGKKFLDSLNNVAKQFKVKIYWIRGNHDNIGFLDETYENIPNQFLSIRENVIFIPDAMKFEMGGVSFLSCGGAYSIDKYLRLEDEAKGLGPETSWFPQEGISEFQTEQCLAQGQVDIVLAHEAPIKVEVFGSHHSRDYINFPESEINRERLQRVCDNASPWLVINGHYHLFNQGAFWVEGPKQVKVITLNCNGSGRESWMILDTEAWKRSLEGS